MEQFVLLMIKMLYWKKRPKDACTAFVLEISI